MLCVMETKVYRVEGMHCEGCVQNVRKALLALPGVKDVQVNLSGGWAVMSSEEPVSIEQARAAVEAAGHYRIYLQDEASTTAQPAQQSKKRSLFKNLFSHRKSCCQ